MNEPAVIYWDSSAIISLLFRDQFSENARSWLKKDGYHFISSLSLSETYGVIARLRAERLLAEFLINEAYEILIDGPWRKITVSPSWTFLHILAKRWQLSGSRLWHLATVKTLHQELPEITLLAFDDLLNRACRGENLQVAYPRQ